MSKSWFCNGDAEIHVDNPGHGTLGIWRLIPAWDAGDEPTREWVELIGRQVGAFLAQLTAFAVGAARKAPDCLPLLEVQHARDMLPAAQAAVALAAAGTDRFERLFERLFPDGYEPLCVRCNEGSPYSDTPTVSEYCAKYGHSPFAYDGSWETASRIFQARQARKAHTAASQPERPR